MNKNVFTTYEVANLCNVTMSTVVNWIKDGSLAAYKTKGGHRRIKKEDLVEFANKHNMPIFFNKRMLIVDDDQAIQTGLQRIFEAEGYEVDVASNGFDAGMLLENRKPSIVILDLVMPGLDGFAVCTQIRKNKELKNTKIIVLTGYPSKENIAKAKKAGADKCLAKPIEKESIVAAVRNLLKN